MILSIDADNHYARMRAAKDRSDARRAGVALPSLLPAHAIAGHGRGRDAPNVAPPPPVAAIVDDALGARNALPPPPPFHANTRRGHGRGRDVPNVAPPPVAATGGDPPHPVAAFGGDPAPVVLTCCNCSSCYAT